MKNLVVKAENIHSQLKGLINLTNYYNDENAPSHINTEITELFNKGDKFVEYVNQNVNDVNLKNALARKGGKPILNW